MNCEDLRKEIPLYLYGELGFDGEEAVESHVAACGPCRRDLQRQQAFHSALDGAQADPPPALLASCRRELMTSVKSEAVAKGTQSGWLDRLFAWTQGGWLKPAGALALVAIGYVAGHSPKATAPAPADILTTRVKNVEPGASGRVQIVLEETRQRTVAGTLSDDGIRKLLLAAAQDPADAGVRVESVDLLRRDSAAADVRQALVGALEGDANPGVRLRALEALRPYANDAEVRRSLARVLLSDDNAGVRTQAVDLLIQSKQKDMVSVLQQSMQREQNDYIRSQTRKALREMNASVDTF